jgi:imidazolonepropionase-like amidohydrolase
MAVVAWLALSAGLSNAMAQDNELCLTGGFVVSPAKRTITRADVIIRGSRIAKVSASQAKCAGKTIDISGAFVVPGFVDTHVHVWGNPSPVAEANDEEWGEEGTARRTLQTGVVAFLSMSAEPEDLALREKLRASPLHTQFVLAAPTYTGAATAKEARSRIAAMVKEGPDLIKLFAGGSQMAAMIGQARALGRKTVVHIANWHDALAAVKAGATAITHLEDEAVIPDDLVQEMAKRKTISIPTMAVQCDMAQLADPKNPPAWWNEPLLQKVLGPLVRADYANAEKFSEKALRTIAWQKPGCTKNDYASIKRLRAAGVRILAGSDTGNLGTFQGYSLHREMQLLAEAGMSNWEALEAGTTAAAAFLELPYGVTEGSEASIVVLEKSPIDDIKNTQRIRHVIHHGKVLKVVGD